MIFDFHIHQEEHSGDSKLNIDDAIKMAKLRNLDGICITDHDSLGLREKYKDYIDQEAVKVIVGVEIFTLDGDILCYGIDQLPRKRMSAQKTIDFVNKIGGVCIAAHPYRKNGRGLGDKIKELRGLVAIEAYNGRTEDGNNIKAFETAQQCGIPICGGSDSHTVMEVGNFATKLGRNIKDEKDFIDALKAGFLEPVTMTRKALYKVQSA